MPTDLKLEASAIDALKQECREERLVAMILRCASWASSIVCAGSLLLFGVRVLAFHFFNEHEPAVRLIWWTVPAGGYLLGRLFGDAADQHLDRAADFETEWRRRDRALREALNMPQPLADRVAARINAWSEAHPNADRVVERITRPEVGVRSYLLWRLIRSLFGGGG
jgi:hypothetical protein